MKRITLEINGSPVTVKVSKWTGRPGANGIRIIATKDSVDKVKECLEAMYNIDINTYIDGIGLYIPEHEAVFLEEATIILGLKKAEARGWLN
jgi:hypothetical protein